MTEVMSAQVVLRPADPDVDVDEPISAANLGRHLPDPRLAEAIRSWFGQRRFTVGPLVANSFSVTGPTELFSVMFGETAIRRDLTARDGEGRLELGVPALPEPLARGVLSVTLAPPPDFGPGAP